LISTSALLNRQETEKAQTVSLPTIRPMSAHETEPVVNLWRRSRAAAQPWLEARMRDVWTDDMGFFRDTIAAENDIWVALEQDTIVGFLAIDGTLLNYLYVDPPAQKRGVGTALLSKAQSLSPGGFTLFTHQRNEGARAFYERRGLRPVAFGVSPPPENEPDVKYAWEPAAK
jgi:GNAT superfamily N-acetyltransferase